MSRTNAHTKAQAQRQNDEPLPKGFDGRRYGNKRKAVAELKVKDRRRTKRAGKRALETHEPPLKRKHVMEAPSR